MDVNDLVRVCDHQIMPCSCHNFPKACILNVLVFLALQIQDTCEINSLCGDTASQRSKIEPCALKKDKLRKSWKIKNTRVTRERMFITVHKVLTGVLGSAQWVPEPDPLPGIFLDTRPDLIQF